jgi:PAS fold.
MMPQLTNRSLAIDTLRVSEAKYRSLFENIDQSVIYLDATGIVMAVNHAAEHLLGLPRDVIIGRKFVDSCFQVIKEDGSVFPEQQQPSMLALRTANPWKAWSWGCLIRSCKIISGLSLIQYPNSGQASVSLIRY